jgi:hypothetical protein
MGNFGVFKGKNSTHFSISEKQLQIFFSTKLKKQKTPCSQRFDNLI